MHQLVIRSAAAAAAGILAATAAVTATAAPAHAEAGKRSVAAVLGADDVRLDRNWNDFDITEQAVLAVVAAKPDSLVGLLGKGNVRLTAFLPTDRAFQFLVKDLTGKAPGSEKKVAKRVLQLVDTDTLEAILLYHVVPGVTLTSEKVLAVSVLNAKVLPVSGDSFFTIQVTGDAVKLRDQDGSSRNPQLVAGLVDVNRGNKQIIHGIDRVLRPVKL